MWQAPKPIPAACCNPSVAQVWQGQTRATYAFAGETGGLLEDSLLRVGDQLDKDDQLRGRVKTAMIYPGFIITFALLVLIALVAFIVPSFVGVSRSRRRT